MQPLKGSVEKKLISIHSFKYEYPDEGEKIQPHHTQSSFPPLPSCLIQDRLQDRTTDPSMHPRERSSIPEGTSHISNLHTQPPLHNQPSASPPEDQTPHNGGSGFLCSCSSPVEVPPRPPEDSTDHWRLQESPKNLSFKKSFWLNFSFFVCFYYASCSTLGLLLAMKGAL